MPISLAMSAVVMRGSPNRLNSASAVSRMRSRVRRGRLRSAMDRGGRRARPTRTALGRRASLRRHRNGSRGQGSETILQGVESAREGARCDLDARTLEEECARIVERGANGVVPVFELSDVEANAVSSEERRQATMLREQALARVAIRGLTQVRTVGIAEDIGEEHVGVFAIGLEQEDVGTRILSPVLFHPDAHPRMNDGAKSLREHQRQSAMIDLLDREP